MYLTNENAKLLLSTWGAFSADNLADKLLMPYKQKY